MKNTQQVTHTFTNPATGEQVPCILQVTVMHDPGIRTYSNGDPGYPPSTEFDIENHNCPEWVTDDMLSDFMDMLDIDGNENIFVTQAV